MYYSVLRLPNGTELKGGEAGSTLKALTLHTAVNAGQEFTIGSAFSDYIEAEIWADPGGSLQITAGDALTYYRQDDAGNRTKVGVFYAEKPTRTKRNSYKVTAYDTMSKLDADFSGWLHANQAQFPKTIWQLVQLGSQLLPVFCDALALIFQVMQPLIPVIGNLAATLLPPLASILSMLVGALLPPLTTILNVVCNDILVPLMPIISTIASAILPPIAQLLGVVAPLLQAIAPILQVIGQILTVVADVIGTIIGWVADGVGAVVNFFDKLFGGAKEAQGGMEDLAESTNSVASSIPDIGTIEMPAVEIPDTSAYTGAIQSAMDTAPIMAEESWGAAKETATSGLEEIGTSANDTYGAMAAQAESAWDRMKTAAASAVSATITELQKLKNAINSVGSITISTGSVTSTPVQGHASGTNDFGGGLTRINEQGGEMAILPSGSQIIPADQTENIINTSRHSKSVTFAPQISVTMSGNASDEEKEQTKAWFLQMCRDAYRQMQNEDTNIEALQASLA